VAAHGRCRSLSVLVEMQSNPSRFETKSRLSGVIGSNVISRELWKGLMLWHHSRKCIVDGPGVPSDQAPAKTMKTVARSSGSSPAITGKPGRLAPSFSRHHPKQKNMRCGCQLISSSLTYCCFAIM
jgi:hypothetical protein